TVGNGACEPVSKGVLLLLDGDYPTGRDRCSRFGCHDRKLLTCLLFVRCSTNGCGYAQSVSQGDNKGVLTLKKYDFLPIQVNGIFHVVCLKFQFPVSQTLYLSREFVPVLHNNYVVLALGIKRIGRQYSEGNQGDPPEDNGLHERRFHVWSAFPELCRATLLQRGCSVLVRWLLRKRQLASMRQRSQNMGILVEMAMRF